MVAPKSYEEDAPPGREKILYYSAFTEDLFYWDNDLLDDTQLKLMIHQNSFTDFIFKEQGQEVNVTRNFQRYTNDKLNPSFNQEYQRQDQAGNESTIKAFSEVTFSVETGGNTPSGNFKISKGEESIFIWSLFYTLLEVASGVLQVAEPDDRDTDQFNQLEYVFIDDPVTSLDENHLIELAVNLAALINQAPPELKFIITTHSPLFYNVMHNELGLKKQNKSDGCYLLERLDDGTYDLNVKFGDSNKSFSYHLHLRRVLEEAISANRIERYHFSLLRNLYEKTAAFLGHRQWGDLLDTVEGDKKSYLNRVIQFSNHSTLSSEEVREPTQPEKQIVKLLLDNLIDNYGYWQQGEQNG
ncbi:MAG: AAA family ATPase [Parasphingorhabdus sp.]|uniref:AAA family ATPase n=1 Tax=Parasphingorhabdus sp. TaxID=2709688 RepID=UPI0030018CDC